jgi:hypothetical protein
MGFEVYAAAQMIRARGHSLIETGSPLNRKREFMAMLETIAVVLLILWVLGLVSSYTMGGFIHPGKACLRCCARFGRARVVAGRRESVHLQGRPRRAH